MFPRAVVTAVDGDGCSAADCEMLAILRVGDALAVSDHIGHIGVL